MTQKRQWKAPQISSELGGEQYNSAGIGNVGTIGQYGGPTQKTGGFGGGFEQMTIPDIEEK